MKNVIVVTSCDDAKFANVKGCVCSFYKVLLNFVVRKIEH